MRISLFLSHRGSDGPACASEWMSSVHKLRLIYTCSGPCPPYQPQPHPRPLSHICHTHYYQSSPLPPTVPPSAFDLQLIVSKVCIVLFATISAAHGALVEWDYCAAGQQTFLSTYGSPAVSFFGVKRDVCSDGHVGWQDLRADRTSRPQAWYWGKPQSNFQSGFTSDFGKVKKWVSETL